MAKSIQNRNTFGRGLGITSAFLFAACIGMALYWGLRSPDSETLSKSIPESNSRVFDIAGAASSPPTAPIPSDLPIEPEARTETVDPVARVVDPPVDASAEAGRKQARLSEIRAYFDEQYRGVAGFQVTPVASATATIAEMEAIDAAREAAGIPYVPAEPEFIPVPENAYPWPEDEIAEALGLASTEESVKSDQPESGPVAESSAPDAPDSELGTSVFEGAPAETVAGATQDSFVLAGAPPTGSPQLKAVSALTVFPAAEGGTIQPPDPHGAAGPNHLLVALNDRVRIQSKDGVVLSNVTLTTFWAPLGTGISSPFDPKVIYDPRSGRFYMTICSNRRSAGSSMLLAVSSTSNPLDAWHMWRFDATATDDQWADYPYIGMTEDKITFSVNMFDHTTTPGTDTFKRSLIWVSDKASALDGGAITTFTFEKSGSSCLAAVLTYDAPGAGFNVTRQHLVSRFLSNSSGKGLLQVFHVDVPTGAANIPANWVLTLSTTRPESPPWKGTTWPAASQLGTTVTSDTGSDRLMNAIQRKGTIWAVHNVGLPSAAATRVSTQWWEINGPNAATPYTTRQTNVIDGGPTPGGDGSGRFYWYGSVAANSAGEVMIGMAGSNATQPLSAYYAHRLESDPLGVMDPVVLLKAGAGPYTGGSRWGDYTATMIDPVDDTTFWSIQMAATAVGNQWGTYWGKLAVAGAPAKPKVTSATATNGTTVRVVFDMAMLNTNPALTAPTNYLFNLANGSPASFVASSVTIVSATSVDVAVDKEMTQGTSYKAIVSASGPTSANGDAVDPAANFAAFSGVSVPPTVTLSTVAPSTTKVSPIPVTVLFSETVTGFTSGDITATNATVSGFTGSGATYSFNLAVTANQGPLAVSASIAAGVAQDGGSNGNLVSNTLTRTFDDVRPAVAMGPDSGTSTVASTITVTVAFTESVTGFDTSDITALPAGVSKGTLTVVNGSTYQFDLILPAGATQMTVTADIAAGAAVDAAGNTSTAATQYLRTFNTSVPTVALSSVPAPGATIGAGHIDVDAVFSESVTGFQTSDIVATNGATVSNFAGSGATYSFDVTPTVNGAFSVSIPSGAATGVLDPFLPNGASNALTWTFDSVGPIATITSASLQTTNAPIPIAITFNEPVPTFAAGNIVVANVVNYTFSTVTPGLSYTATLTPAGDGVVSATIAAGSISDAFGNANADAVTLQRTFDGTRPALTLGPVNGAVTKTSPMAFTAVFGESVTGFDAADVAIVNGSVASVTGSGSSYTINVTPAADGVVKVNAAAGGAQDGAGNTNTAAVEVARLFDSSSPTATITVSQATANNVSPIPVTVTFGESVTGFVATDVVVTNGSVQTFAGSGSVYTFGVAPTAQGSVTVNVAAGVAQDAAANGNLVAATLTRTFDSVGPTVAVSSTVVSPTKNSPVPFVVTFNEAVADFDLSDVTAVLSNGATPTVSNFVPVSGGKVYNFDVTPAGAGSSIVVTVSVAAGLATDGSGNPNTASANFSRSYDPTAPTVALGSTAPNLFNAAPITVTAVFNENVTGFAASDVAVSGVGGTVQNFVATDAKNYSFTVTPLATGTIGISVPAGAASDGATNGNQASSTLTRTFDNTAPEVAISSGNSANGSTSNVSPIPFTVTFNESVTGFDLSEVTVTGGTKTAVSFPSSGAVYTLNVAPTQQGAVTVNVGAGVAIDAANNGNTAASQFSRIFDTVAPIATIASASLANATPLVYSVTFSESVTGFDQVDIGVDKGVVGPVTGSVATYAFTLTPPAGQQGTVTATIAPGLFADSAGNANTAAASLTKDFDYTVPSFSLSPSTIASPTNQAPVPFTVTTSEPVTGFVSADIAPIGGAIVADFLKTGTTTYTFKLSPANQGAFGLSIPAGAAQDASGNGTTAVPTISAIYDSIRPVPHVTSGVTPGATTSTASISLTVAFKAGTLANSPPDPVQGFSSSSGDIQVTGAGISAFAGSGDIYNITLTPTAPGPVTFKVLDGAASDGANTSEASAVLSWIFDNVAPTFQISSTGVSGSATNVSPIPFTVLFNENVSGFGLSGDIVVTGGSASVVSFPESGTAYTFVVAPTGDGAVTVSVAAGAANDAANNTNAGSAPFSRLFDGSDPTVTLSSTEGSPTNAALIPVTVAFSEAIQAFSEGDVTVTGAAIVNFAGSGAGFSFDLDPAGEGLVTATVNAAAANDPAGNLNAVSGQLSLVYDATGPGAVITSSVQGQTNDSSIPVTVTFSEDVDGFIGADIQTSGTATVANFSGAGAVYTFDLEPVVQGPITATFGAGAASDAAGNGNTAPAPYGVSFDSGAPVLSLTPASAAPTNAAPVTVTATFTEDVDGFTEADVTATNAAVQNFSGVGDSYSFDLVPLSQGEVTATVAAGAAVDGVGNATLAGSEFSRIYDSEAPGVSVSSTAPSDTNVSPIPVTIAFTEAVGDFALGDLILNINATASNLQGDGQTFTVDVTPIDQGDVTVGVDAGVAQDAASNANTAAGTNLARSFDNIQPSVSMSSGASATTNVVPIVVTVQFSEPVTGFTADGVTKGNASLTNFVQVDGDTYTFGLVPLAQGTVTAGIAADVATDAAGNLNTVAGAFSRNFASNEPTVVMSAAAATDPTNLPTISVTVTFSEPMNGFDATDLNPNANGAIDGFAGSGALYTFNLTPVADGLVTVDIAAGAADDGSANFNSAAPQFSRIVDTSGPTIVLSSSAGSTTNDSPIPVTVALSEAVVGFDVSDISAGNDTIQNFQAIGALEYRFDVVPSAVLDSIGVSVAASAANDAAGNDSDASNLLNVTYDGKAPAPAILFGVASPASSAPIPVTVTFDESVVGFDGSDVAVTNGTLANFTGSGTTYNFNVASPSPGIVTVIIGAGAAEDTVGNANIAGDSESISFDDVPPTVAMSSGAPSTTNSSPILVSVIFSEPVTGFTAPDIGTVNGTVDGFAGSGASYAFSLTPTTTSGLVTATILAGVAVDLANNPNVAASPFNRTFDSVAPGVTLSSTATGPVTKVNPIPMTAQFTEGVTGFTAADISAGGASVNNLVAVDADTYTFVLVPSAGNTTVTAGISAGAAVDAAGNTSTAAAPSFSIAYDGVAPTVIMTSAIPATTNVTPIPVTVTFSETVFGFTSASIGRVNANVTDFAVSGATYTFNLVPISNGTVTASIAGGAVFDAAGNPNVAAPAFSRIFNNSQPVPTISSTVAGTAFNSTPLPVTVTFSEPVTGFAVSDFVLVNATASGFTAVNSSQYTVSITPVTQGLVTVNIPAGAANSLANNPSNAAVPFSKTYDTLRPSVSSFVTSVNNAPFTGATNGSPVLLRITFSEPMPSFTSPGLIDLTNATANTLTSVAPNIFTVNLVPANGKVTVTINQAGIVDAAGNRVFRGSSSFTFDNVPPQSPDSVFQSDYSVITNVSPIPVTISFPEIVVGFDPISEPGDMILTNATMEDFTEVDPGLTYRLNLVPIGQGDVRASIPSGVAADEVGNPIEMTEANDFVIEYDSVAPAVDSIVAASSDPTNASPIPVTVTFTEEVNGFIEADVNATNAALSDFVPLSQTQFTFNLIPASDDAVTLAIAASAATDIVGNASIADERSEFSIQYDGTAPLINEFAEVIVEVPTNTSPIPMSVAFSEPVLDFDASDINCTNGISVDNFSGGNGIYTFDLVVPAGTSGQVAADIGAGAAHDAAGNVNPSRLFTRDFDNAAPTITFLPESRSLTNELLIADVIVRFNEPVTDFTVDDLDPQNAAVQNFRAVDESGDGNEYLFDLVPSADGPVSVSVGAGAAQDAVGNPNTAAETPFSVEYDGTAPLATMTSSAPDTVNTAPIAVTVTFSESVSDFDATDLSATNAVVENFAGSGTEYTFDLASPGDGIIAADIAAGAVADAAGNSTAVDAHFDRLFDSTRPHVVMSSNTPADTSTNDSPIAVVATFSEAVTGFIVEDIVLGNAAIAAGSFVSVNQTVTFDLIPGADGPVTADIPAGAAVDGAGNESTEAVAFVRDFDSNAPSLVLSSTAPANTSVSPISITAQFSEPVFGFSQDDIERGNATVADFESVDGDTYTFALVPTANGAITARVTEVAHDEAGNLSESSNEFSRVFDNISPVIESMTSETASPTNESPVTVSVTFSEEVTDFELADIAAANAVASNLAGSGAAYTFDLARVADGPAAASIPDGKVHDLAGKGNIASGQFAMVFDTTPPAVELESAVENPTLLRSIPVAVQFSEPVSGFDFGDIAVTSANATVSAFTGSGSLYGFNLIPTSNGDIEVSLAPGAATDAATNPSDASNVFAITFSGDIPAIVMNSVAGPFTNVTPIPVTVAFTTPVTLTAPMIQLSNATIAGFSGSGTAYRFDLVPRLNGEVRATIPAGAVGAGSAAATLIRFFDSARPNVELSSAEPDPTDANTIPMSVVFDEDVVGFDALDVATNAAASGFVSIDRKHYLFTLTPSGPGVVTVSVPEAAAADEAGNPNTASAVLTRTVDTVGPAVESVALLGAPAASAAEIQFEVVFSEPVEGVDTASPFRDFALNDDPDGSILQSAILGVTGTGDTRVVTVHVGVTGELGDVEADFPTLRLEVKDDNSIVDALGNPLGGLGEHDGDFAAGDLHAVERADASIVIGSPSPPVTASGEVTFLVTYIGVDAEVIGANELTPADISLVAEEADDFGEGTEVDPDPSVKSAVKAGIAPPPFENEHTPHAAVIQVEPVEGNAFAFEVTLGEITGDGLLSIFIGDNDASPLSALVGSALSENIVVDNTAPAAEVIAFRTNSAPAAPAFRTNSDAVNFDVVFSEAVNTFDRNDVGLAAGSLPAALSDPERDEADPRRYRITAIPADPDADGPLGIVVGLAGQDIDDAAGNPFAGAISEAEYVIDNSPPSISIDPPRDPVTGEPVTGAINGPVEFLITYGEDDALADQTEITLVSADVNLEDDGTSAFGVISVLEDPEDPLARIVRISNIIGDGSLGISLEAGTARDSVGNQVPATGASDTFPVDNDPIIVTIGAPSRISTTTETVRYTVSYTGAKAITLDASDIVINKTGTAVGSVVDISGEVSNFNRDVTIGNISGNGTLGITVLSGTATDDVGEVPGGAGPSATVLVDNDPPTLSIGPPSVSRTSSTSVTFVVTYEGASSITLDREDIILSSNGDASADLSLTVSSPTSKTVVLSNIRGDGSLSFVIGAGTAEDAAGNRAPAAASGQVVVDNTGPAVTVARARGQLAVTDTLPIFFDIVFDEDVTGFTASDVDLGGTAGGVEFSLEGSGAEYSVVITEVTEFGTISCTVAEGAASDLLANASQASTGTANTVEFKEDVNEGCELSSVQLNLAADGMTFIIPVGASEPVPLTVSATTNCETGTLDVLFLVDGEARTTDPEPIYAVTLDDVLSLGVGEHVLTAIARSAEDGNPTFEDTVTIVIAAAPAGSDSDGNTLPDDPFATLDTEGDTWASTGETVAAGATFWEGGAKQGDALDVTMSLRSEFDPDVQVTVSAPRELIEEGESAILVVMIAPDLIALYGAEEADLLGPEPVEGLVAGGHYVEASILVSSDGGLTFSEISNARLAANPAQFVLDGIGVIDGTQERLFSHATRVDNSGDAVQVLAGGGEWDGSHVRNVRVLDGRIEADLTGFSVFAPYRGESAAGANISVNPLSHDFGDVAVGASEQFVFTVTNTGTGKLTGSVNILPPFELVSEGTYSLDHAESKSVVIRFAPDAKGSVTKDIVFTGGDGATITLIGTGVSGGCNASAGGVGLAPSHGDSLVFATLLAMLLTGMRVRRRNRPIS